MRVAAAWAAVLVTEARGRAVARETVVVAARLAASEAVAAAMVLEAQ